jgi:hypothetical protein
MFVNNNFDYNIAIYNLCRCCGSRCNNSCKVSSYGYSLNAIRSYIESIKLCNRCESFCGGKCSMKLEKLSCKCESSDCSICSKKAIESNCKCGACSSCNIKSDGGK